MQYFTCRVTGVNAASAKSCDTVRNCAAALHASWVALGRRDAVCRIEPAKVRLSGCQEIPRSTDGALCGPFTMVSLFWDGGLGLERLVTCLALGAGKQACTLHESTCRTYKCKLQNGGIPFGHLREMRDICIGRVYFSSQIARSRSAGRIKQNTTWVKKSWRPTLQVVSHCRHRLILA